MNGSDKHTSLLRQTINESSRLLALGSQGTMFEEITLKFFLLIFIAHGAMTLAPNGKFPTAKLSRTFSDCTIVIADI